MKLSLEFIIGFFLSTIVLFLFCLDPVHNSPSITPDQVSLKLTGPIAKPNEELVLKIGDQVSLSVFITYPKFVDSLFISFGETANKNNALRQKISSNSNNCSVYFTVIYKEVGEKLVRATIRYKDSLNNKDKGETIYLSIGMAPKIIDRLIKCYPASVILGMPCTLAVESTEFGIVNYCWSRDGMIISTTTSKKFIISPCLKNNEGTYVCLAQNKWGVDTSSEFNLVSSSNLKPQIVQQPQNQQIEEKKTVIFTCIALPESVVYQWYRNGVMLSGETKNTLSIQSVSVQDNASKFKCKVSNPVGEVFSNEVTLTIKINDQPEKPKIIQQPNDVDVIEGNDAIFTVHANGKDLQYQWQKNSVIMQMEIASTLKVSQVQNSDSGAKFKCLIRNINDTVVSREALLRVKRKDAPPTIIKQPLSQTIKESNPVTFDIEAKGNNLNFQWHRNGVVLSGETKNYFTIQSVSMQDNASKFKCKVNNSAGEVFSDEVTLIVQKTELPEKPKIIQQPNDVDVIEGNDAIFTVHANGKDLQYQWQKNSVIMQMEIASTLKVSQVQNSDSGAKFKCLVRNAIDTVVSREALLRVNRKDEAPTILKQPVSQTINESSPVTFDIGAKGNNLNFQWYRNGVKLSGEVKNNFTIQSVSMQDNNSKFKCKIFNQSGEVFTNEVTLVVIPKSKPQTVIAHWTFDEGTGSIARDISGNGNDFTLSNAQWGSGIKSGAIVLNNSATKGVCEHNSSQSGWKTVTFEVVFMLMKYPSDNKKSIILQKWGPGSYEDDVFGIGLTSVLNGSQKMSLNIAGETKYNLLEGTKPVPIQKWIHMVYTFNSNGQEKLYLNGVATDSIMISDKTVFNSNPLTSTIKMELAVYNEYLIIDGKIDDLKIYKEALEPAVIKMKFDSLEIIQ